MQKIELEKLSAITQVEIYNHPSAGPVQIAVVPVLGACTSPALGQYWLVMLGCTACAVLETSTDSVLSNHWLTKMPDLSFLYHRLSIASIVEPTFHQYWVNCRISVLVNCTGPVLRQSWPPTKYRNFHLGTFSRIIVRKIFTKTNQTDVLCCILSYLPNFHKNTDTLLHLLLNLWRKWKVTL